MLQEKQMNLFYRNLPLLDQVPFLVTQCHIIRIVFLKYFVNVNGKNSEIKTVNIGVPQGSTLGLLFFLSYIKDMSCCMVEKVLELSQFADNSTMSISSITLKQAIKIAKKN